MQKKEKSAIIVWQKGGKYILVDLQQSFATFYNKYKDDYASEADAFIDFLASRE